MQTRSCKLLDFPETMATITIHGTELLQMSWSAKQGMRSKHVMWLLQPIVFS